MPPRARISCRGVLRVTLLVACGSHTANTTATPSSAAPRAPLVAITHHSGEFNGVRLKYAAIEAETYINDATGKPAAVMVTTAYVRDGVKDKTKRPVMFIFNGGPGASSSPLHTRPLGVLRTVGGEGERHLGHNPYSPIDVADLVFIDPIGTGFSHTLAGIDGQPFWSVKGDADSVRSFIHSWLTTHGRDASPVFICGESYGTVRAAQLAYISPELNIAGVVLVSLGAGPGGGPELPFVTALPTYAVTAVYHGKVDAAGRTVPEIFAEAAKFARTDFMGALLQGTSLSAADEQRMAQEVSKRIGLPAQFIADRHLRVSADDFIFNLLKEEGVRLGLLDGRATGKFEDFASRRPPYNDPGLGAGLSAPRGPSGSDFLQAYLTHDLKFPATQSYVGLNLDVNSKWKFDVDEAKNAAGRIGAAMREQPHLRLLWTAGYYDVGSPVAAGQYAIYNSGVPAARVTVQAFEAGHEVYSDKNLPAFTAAVRKFVQGESPGR